MGVNKVHKERIWRKPEGSLLRAQLGIVLATKGQAPVAGVAYLHQLIQEQRSLQGKRVGNNVKGNVSPAAPLGGSLCH